MKIVVSSGRTVHLGTGPSVKQSDDRWSRPSVKAHGPTSLIDVPEKDAAFLVARGFASKYEERKAVVENAEKTEPAKSK